MAADDDGAGDVYEHSGGTNRLRSDRVQAGRRRGGERVLRGGLEDGSRVFFQTQEAVVSEDDDAGAIDIFERAANVTTLVSVGDTGNNLGFAGLTPDGTRVFLHANGPLGDDDDDTNIDLYERAAGATTLLSDRIQPGDDADENAFFAGTSADGSRVFFNTESRSSPPTATAGPTCTSAAPASPRRCRIESRPGADGEFDAELVGASADGTRVYLRTEEQLTDGDSDAVHDLYVARVAPPPPPDGDGDGVPDSTDACPDVAANTADGCPPPPPDGDGDGVPDSSDACPDVAATTADGCPPPDPDPDPDPDPVVPTNPDAPSDPIVPPGPGDPTGPFEPLGAGAPLGPAGPRGPTDGDDLLNGTPAADRICGLLGNDTINGLAGNDTLAGDACGGRGRGGNDTLKGGAGRDRLIGGAGVNKYDGGPRQRHRQRAQRQARDRQLRRGRARQRHRRRQRPGQGLRTGPPPAEALSVSRFMLVHSHGPRDCRVAFAAWRGFDSPLRHRAAAASCAAAQGDGCAHRIWWAVEAPDETAALAHLPPWVAERTVIDRVSDVAIP